MNELVVYNWIAKRTRSEGEDCDNDNNDGETCSGEEPKKLDSLQRRI